MNRRDSVAAKPLCGANWPTPCEDCVGSCGIEEYIEEQEARSAASPLDIDALLGKTRFVVPPELMDNTALVKVAYAAQACLEQWAQGRGAPPRLTSEERALRDALGLDLEVFGDARS